MKSLLVSSVSLLLLIFVYAFNPAPAKQVSEIVPLETNPGIEVPDDVQAILDKSCLPCHGPDGSGKAKMKWNWEKMPGMSTTKQISKLSKVVDKVNADKMPTPKYLKKHPDAKLSGEQKKTLTDWAENTAEGMLSGE